MTAVIMEQAVSAIVGGVFGAGVTAIVAMANQRSMYQDVGERVSRIEVDLKWIKERLRNANQ